MFLVKSDIKETLGSIMIVYPLQEFYDIPTVIFSDT